MAERHIKKPRKCRHCQKDVESDARGIKKHSEQCRGKSEIKKGD